MAGMNAPLETLRAPPAGATFVRYHVLAALCVATTIAYIDRGCIQMAVEPIRADLGLSEPEMGYAIGAFFVAYALLQLPTGWLAHVWGTRRALPFFAALWSAFTGLCAAATGFPSLLLARGGMGAAEAGIFPAAAASIAQWFPQTRRAGASGVLGSFMGVGGALGTVLTGWLLLSLSWRWVFVLYAVPGLLWAAWFYLWFRERPREHPAVNASEVELIEGKDADVSNLLAKQEELAPFRGDAAAPGSTDAERFTPEAPRSMTSGRQENLEAEAPRLPGVTLTEDGRPTPWGAILASPAMWWINGQQFFRAAAYVFFMSWFPTYLQRTKVFSLEETRANALYSFLISALASMPHIAMVLGSLAGGFIADWLLARTGSRRWSRQGLAVASLIVCALLTCGSYALEDAVLAALVISIAAFCASLAGPSAYAVTIDLGRQHVAPVFSVMNMAGNVGAIPLPALAPLLAAWSGSWQPILFVFAGLYLAAAVCWLFLDPDRPIIPGERGT